MKSMDESDAIITSRIAEPVLGMVRPATMRISRAKLVEVRHS